MQLSLPLFSFVYFGMSWVFVTVFCLFLVYHAFYKSNYQSAYLAAGYERHDSEIESDEEDDLHNFLRETLQQAALTASATQAQLAEKIQSDKWAAAQEQRCWDN